MATDIEVIKTNIIILTIYWGICWHSDTFYNSCSLSLGSGPY